MQVFYSQEIDGSQIYLTDQEASHCTRVLRKKVGDQLFVIDGKGHLFHCTFVNATRDRVELNIDKTEVHPQMEYRPQIAVGLLKNAGRIEWMIEKLVEIGIHSFIPLRTQRSERKVLKLERIQKVVIAAAKQSLCYHFPLIHEPLTLKEFLGIEHRQSRYIASFHPNNFSLGDVVKKNEGCSMLIGPEGDFTEEEIKLAADTGWEKVNLGQTRLRTETAAIVACTLINHA